MPGTPASNDLPTCGDVPSDEASSDRADCGGRGSEAPGRGTSGGGAGGRDSGRGARCRPRHGRLSALEVATYGALAGVALVFGYVESVLPAPVPVPGVKLGLGNVVVLFCLEAFGARPAALLMVVKVTASALLFGSPAVFMYSLAGGVASVAAMTVAARVRAFSVSGVSMAGGVFHMVGQMLVVAAVLSPQVALTYLPVLLVSGLLAGLLVGYLCRAALAATAGSGLVRERAKRMRAAAGSGAGKREARR